ncbi:MAG: hypothetical protein WA635_10925 [Gallionella sp.]
MSFLIGIDEGRGLVFEGDSTYGAHLVWPVPVMTPAQFVDSSAKEFAGFQVGGVVTYYFREDMFDPVSRIRRGRFYKFENGRGTWEVLPVPHVTIPRMGAGRDGLLSVPSLTNYCACAVSIELNNLGIANAVVILGKGKSSTVWNIIHVEASFTGEEMVTLKARQSLGALPQMDLEVLREIKNHNIQEALQTLEDDYHLASPESVVDRANEAATRIMNAFLDLKKRPLQDSLFKAITEAGKLGPQDKREIVRNAADVIRLLHGRTKYAVQREKNTREVREQDAELAVQCIGVMLCDLGWAAWR